MELSRKALEILRDCYQNKMACADCPPHKPPEQICYRFLWTSGEIAALALSLMDERDRYRAALELIDRATRDYGIGIGATCNNTAHYALEPAQKEAAHAEAGQ